MFAIAGGRSLIQQRMATGSGKQSCDFLKEGDNLLKIEAVGVPVTDSN